MPLYYIYTNNLKRRTTKPLLSSLLFSSLSLLSWPASSSILPRNDLSFERLFNYNIIFEMDPKSAHNHVHGHQNRYLFRRQFSDLIQVIIWVASNIYERSLHYIRNSFEVVSRFKIANMRRNLLVPLMFHLPEIVVSPHWCLV